MKSIVVCRLTGTIRGWLSFVACDVRVLCTNHRLDQVVRYDML